MYILHVHVYATTLCTHSLGQSVTNYYLPVTSDPLPPVEPLSPPTPGPEPPSGGPGGLLEEK